MENGKLLTEVVAAGERQEVADAVTFAAMRAYDRRPGYSKLERMRDALEAVMPTQEQIAAALRAHPPRIGMVVASGVTCECGYWNGVESPGNDRPAGSQGRDGLNWHRAQVVLALLNGESK